MALRDDPGDDGFPPNGSVFKLEVVFAASIIPPDQRFLNGHPHSRQRPDLKTADPQWWGTSWLWMLTNEQDYGTLSTANAEKL